MDISYVSNGTGANYVQLTIEVSNDAGTTFFQQAVKVDATTEIDLYDLDGSGNAGVPLTLPGGKTSTSGTTYTATYDNNVVGDYVRVSAKETKAVGSAGTLYVRMTIAKTVR